MKSLFTSLCLMMLVVLPGTTRPSDTARCRLGVQAALGYGCFREPGASPLTYRGAEFFPALSLEWERGIWRTDGALRLAAGAYGNRADGFGIQAMSVAPQAQWRLWRRCAELGAWQLYGGIGLTEMFDLRYFTQLENSSVGMTNALYASLCARAERACGRWMLHGTAAFHPAGWMFRPGYAFISNYDRTPDSPVTSTFDQYHGYLAGACGLESEWGAAFCLANGNRIGLRYRWHHFTSRSSRTAPYRFDMARHTFTLHLMLQL